jgi:hypothetical protein
MGCSRAAGARSSRFRFPTSLSRSEVFIPGDAFKEFPVLVTLGTVFAECCATVLSNCSSSLAATIEGKTQELGLL